MRLIFYLNLITTVAEPVHHVPQQSSHVSARVQPTVCSYNGGCTHTNKLKCVQEPRDGTRERAQCQGHTVNHRSYDDDLQHAVSQQLEAPPKRVAP